MAKKYCLIFSDRENFTWNLEFLFAKMSVLEEEFDVTLVGFKENKAWGATGGYNQVPYCKNLLRKPDVVFAHHGWWDQAHNVCLWARQHRIPVVVLEHGVTLWHQPQATYRATIGQADRACLWSARNLEVTKLYGRHAAQGCIVTGNPQYDVLQYYTAPPERIPGTPKDYALVLSTWSIQKDAPRHHANALAKIIPCVLKVHPNETFYKNRKPARIVGKEVVLVYDQAALLQLIYHAKIVVSTISSAMLTAMYWKKPIYIVNKPEPKQPSISSFIEDFQDVFNWKPEPIWSEKDLESPKIATTEDFIYFGGPADGKNTERVIDVIKSLL